MKLNRLLILFTLTAALGACKDDKPRKSGVAAPSVKNVKVDFQNAERSKLAFGDTLRIALSFEADQAFRSVSIESEEGPLPTKSVDSLVYAVPSVAIGGGYHSIRARVLLEDSTIMRGSASIRVVRESIPPTWEYRLIEAYPHDPTAYTQGLLYTDGWIYESAGRYGLSDLRQVNWRTGAVERKQGIDDDYFAEGLARFGDELYQLTWRESKVFVHDLKTLSPVRTFNINIGNGEGWGLCFADSVFVLSDGSADLYFIAPEDWQVSRKLRVFDHQGDVRNLNELEYVGGKIYANMLHDDRIAVIDPQTGMIQAYWDLSGLLASQDDVGRVDVMNGIAYCPDRSSFFVTGKLWPYLFEVTPVFR